MVNPANNATNQRTTSRVGVTLSDWIDLRSVTTSTFTVRPVGGSALAGKYSGEQGILNFWPNQPFVAGTTYEVVIPAGGLRDFSGNTAPSTFTSRFTIAGTTVTPTPATATPTPTPTPGGPTPTPGTFSGYYRLTARHSGKAVVVQSASTANGANVIQWTYTSGTTTNDEWSFSDLGGGYYHIVNRHSGKVMNVSGASTVNGGDVIQWGATSGTNDDWQMVDLGTGYYRIANRNSGKVLNVAGASTADGANVDQWSWANVNQQQFQVVSVP
jgi:hypothetical protein